MITIHALFKSELVNAVRVYTDIRHYLASLNDGYSDIMGFMYVYIDKLHLQHYIGSLPQRMNATRVGPDIRHCPVSPSDSYSAICIYDYIYTNRTNRTNS